MGVECMCVGGGGRGGIDHVDVRSFFFFFFLFFFFFFFFCYLCTDLGIFMVHKIDELCAQPIEMCRQVPFQCIKGDVLGRAPNKEGRRKVWRPKRRRIKRHFERGEKKNKIKKRRGVVC
jgi:hypothetical protein